MKSKPESSIIDSTELKQRSRGESVDLTSAGISKRLDKLNELYSFVRWVEKAKKKTGHLK